VETAEPSPFDKPIFDEINKSTEKKKNSKKI
jgi:hypothetical protein